MSPVADGVKEAYRVRGTSGVKSQQKQERTRL